MFFLGWASLGGAEVWNVERTMAYLEANAPLLEMTGCDSCATMPIALADAPYKNNPADDPAPWVGTDDPDMADFYGFYPTQMEGLYDGNVEVTITESIGDGGTASTQRRKTKEMRVSGVLLAQTRVALAKGGAWFRNMLASAGCDTPGSCAGMDLCFFVDCPADLAQGDYYQRTLRDVVLSDGPTITQAYGQLSSGVYMDKVEFTLVAATPWIYGPIDDLGSTLGSAGTTNGVIVVDEEVPALPDCQFFSPAPISDPTVPPLPSPPRPPAISSTMHPPLPYQSGFSIFIPQDHVPDVLEAVLVITLTTGVQAARWVRLRLFAVPLGFDQKIGDMDPCSYCGDITITYIPPNSQFVIDGMNQTVTIIDTAGNTYPANNLVFTGGGLPASWASITCALPYWMAVEFSGPVDPHNLFVTGAASDSSTFNTNIGSWTNGPNDGTPRATLARDTGQFHNSPASMKVNWPSGSTDRPQVQVTGLVPGQTYQLGMWVLTPPTARVRLDLQSDGGVQSNVVTTLRTNLAIDPNATATANYSLAAGTGGSAGFTAQTSGSPNSTTFVRSTWTVGTSAVSGSITSGPSNASRAAVSPGLTYTASGLVRSSVAQRIAIQVHWFDSAGAFLTSSAATTVVLVANTWTAISAAALLAPANAAFASVAFSAVVGGGGVNWGAGNTFDVSSVMVELTSTAGTFFSGATSGTGSVSYFWTSTANASPSIATTVAAWQYLTVNVVPTASTRTVRLSNANGTSPTGDIYVDDFVLRDVTTSENSIVKVDLVTARKQ